MYLLQDSGIPALTLHTKRPDMPSENVASNNYARFVDVRNLTKVSCGIPRVVMVPQRKLCCRLVRVHTVLLHIPD